MEETRRALKEQFKWRGFVITIGGIMVHMTLGSMYTFGNLSPYLISYLKSRTDDKFIRNVDGIWIYALTVVGQGCGMLNGGFLERKLGPRIATLIGGWIMSVGVCVTSLTVKHSFLAVLGTYGFINGFGIGIAYGIPIATAMKWNDSKRGLTSGFVVSGFAAGAFIFNQAVTAFLNPQNKNPQVLDPRSEERYFTEKDILNRVPDIFWMLGSIYAGMQLIGVLLLKRPKLKRKEQIITVSMKVTMAERRGYLEQKRKAAERLEALNNAKSVDEILDRRESGVSAVTSEGSFQVLPATTVDIDNLPWSRKSSVDSDDVDGVYNTVHSTISSTTMVPYDTEDDNEIEHNLQQINPAFVGDDNEGFRLPPMGLKKKKAVYISEDVNKNDQNQQVYGDNNNIPTIGKKRRYSGMAERNMGDSEMGEMTHRVRFNSSADQRRRHSTAERLVLEFRRISRRLSVPEFVFRNLFKRSNSRRERMLKPLKLFKTKTFYKLWFIFVLNGQGIAFMLTLWKTYAQTFITDDFFLSTVGACASLFNAFGRITWGIVADKFTFRVSMMSLSTIFAVFTLTLNVTELMGKPLFFIWMCLINFGFAGNFALLPFASSRAVAHICVGAPGAVFSAMTVSGAIGAVLTVELQETIGWHGMFFLSGGLSIVVIMIAFTFDAETPSGEKV